MENLTVTQEGYIEELTRFSQCLNAKTGFVNFWRVHQSFLYSIFVFQIEHFQKTLEGQYLNRIRLSAPLYILLETDLLSYTYTLSCWQINTARLVTNLISVDLRYLCNSIISRLISWLRLPSYLMIAVIVDWKIRYFKCFKKV